METFCLLCRCNKDTDVEDFTRSRINGNTDDSQRDLTIKEIVEDFTRSRINGNNVNIMG